MVPQALKNGLWDQSHRCPQITYGIDPIGLLKSPLGLIPYIARETHQEQFVRMVPQVPKNGLWDRSHRCPQITYGIDPIGLLKSPLGLIPYIAGETHQEEFVRMVPQVPKIGLWDRSHRCPQITYGIDPTGLLKEPMGSIPQVLSGHLWDRSQSPFLRTYGTILQNCSGLVYHTFYGINPTSYFWTSMGSIPQVT